MRRPQQLIGIELTPEIEGRRCRNSGGESDRLTYHEQHLIEFLFGGFVRIFVEPLWQQSLGRDAGFSRPVDFVGAVKKDVGSLRHHGDAEAKRHSGASRGSMKGGLKKPNLG